MMAGCRCGRSAAFATAQKLLMSFNAAKLILLVDVRAGNFRPKMRRAASARYREQENAGLRPPSNCSGQAGANSEAKSRSLGRLL